VCVHVGGWAINVVNEDKGKRLDGWTKGVWSGTGDWPSLVADDASPASWRDPLRATRVCLPSLARLVLQKVISWGRWGQHISVSGA
jgi:hypothetical protein